MRRIVMVLLIGLTIVCGVPVLSAAADNDEGLFDTKDAAAHLEKGIAHLKNKKYDAAIRELDEAASINPDAESYYYLGYAYYMKGRKGDAESRKKSIDCFEKAYELNPRFTPSRFKPEEAAKTMPVPEPQSQETTSSETPQATAPAVPTEPAPSSAPTSKQTTSSDVAPPEPAAGQGS